MNIRELVFILYVTCLLFSSISTERYAYDDEPDCRDDCFISSTKDTTECKNTYDQFYSYKLVKGLFNFGKTSVYAGVWTYRYEKADETLFEKVFMTTLSKYNNTALLGNVNYEQLNKLSVYMLNSMKPYWSKKTKDNVLANEYYPSLTCSTPCNYEKQSWQTLFYLSLTIFILALTTVILYSVSLRSQYRSLKTRLENFKSTTAETANINT